MQSITVNHLLIKRRRERSDCLFCVIFILMHLLYNPRISFDGRRSFIYLSNKRIHFFPASQVMRVLVFGCIAGTAITLAAIVFNLIDKFNSRKKTPSDPE